jgi:hypothetical protein
MAQQKACQKPAERGKEARGRVKCHLEATECRKSEPCGRVDVAVFLDFLRNLKYFEGENGRRREQASWDSDFRNEFPLAAAWEST